MEFAFTDAQLANLQAASSPAIFLKRENSGKLKVTKVTPPASHKAETNRSEEPAGESNHQHHKNKKYKSRRAKMPYKAF
jgi:hypothetical protein